VPKKKGRQKKGRKKGGHPTADCGAEKGGFDRTREGVRAVSVETKKVGSPHTREKNEHDRCVPSQGKSTRDSTDGEGASMRWGVKRTGGAKLWDILMKREVKRVREGECFGEKHDQPAGGSRNHSEWKGPPEKCGGGGGDG